MILNEQKYDQKSKIYYHGTDTGKFIIGQYEAGFLTTDPLYALHYTNKFQVIKGYLRAPLNIFNARSNIDMTKLLKYVKIPKVNFDQLKNSDWLHLPWSDLERKDLIKITKQFGYDGFFNFEIEREKNPSIGLYDSDNFIIETILQYEDLIKIGRIKSFIEQEQDKFEIAIIGMAHQDKSRNISRSKQDFIDVITKNSTKYIQKKYPDIDDLYKIYLDNNTLEKLREELFNQNCYLEALYERFGKRYSYKHLINEYNLYLLQEG